MRTLANCEQYRDLISASLDGVLTPEEQQMLDSHLTGCPDCRAAWEQLSALEPMLMELEDPGVDFTDRVMAAAAQTEQDIPFTALPQNRQAGKESRKQLMSWWKPIRTLGALAVCCVLILGIGQFVVRLNGGSFSASDETADTAAATEPEDSAAAETESGPISEDASDSDFAAGDAAADQETAQDSEAGDEAVKIPALVLEGRVYCWTGETAASTDGFAYAGTVADTEANGTEFAGWDYYFDTEHPERCLLTNGQTIQVWQIQSE